MISWQSRNSIKPTTNNNTPTITLIRNKENKKDGGLHQTHQRRSTKSKIRETDPITEKVIPNANWQRIPPNNIITMKTHIS
jgi:hypothetical protein